MNAFAPSVKAPVLPFGQTLSAAVLYCEHDGSAWNAPGPARLQDLAVPLAGPALQYGLSVFEGLKAYRAEDTSVHLFRPQDHARRLRASAERLGLPAVPEALFLHACAEITGRLADDIPDHGQGALYLRPTLYALDQTLGLRPAVRHGFAVVGNPCADPAFKSLRLWAEPDLIRAAPGGLGGIKTAANYAAGLGGLLRARTEGYDDVLWLDAATHRWLGEAGSMNIFAEIDGMLVTPPLDGTILPGVTRAQVLNLAPEIGIPVMERALSLDELVQAAGAGRLGSLFGTGTASRVVSISRIANADVSIAAGSDVTARRVYDRLKHCQETVSALDLPVVAARVDAMCASSVR